MLVFLDVHAVFITVLRERDRVLRNLCREDRCSERDAEVEDRLREEHGEDGNNPETRVVP